MRRLIADFSVLIEEQKRREDQALIGYVNKLLAAFGKATDVHVHPSSLILHPSSSHLHFAEAQVSFIL